MIYEAAYTVDMEVEILTSSTNTTNVAASSSNDTAPADQKT